MGTSASRSVWTLNLELVSYLTSPCVFSSGVIDGHRLQIYSETVHQGCCILTVIVPQKFSFINTKIEIFLNILFAAVCPCCKEIWDNEEEIPVDPFPYLKKGQRVYVRSGPFKGVEGFIVRKDKHCRLVVSLDMLMQSVSIVIDEAEVEIA